MKKIKGTFKDLTGAFRVSKAYAKSVSAASESKEFADPINALAKKLHPGVVTLSLDERVEVTKDAYFLTFHSLDKAIPLFKPGQYLTLTKQIGSSILTRAYSICSDCRKRDSVSILIKKLGGPFTEFLSTCPIGETFASEIGLGPFYYEPLRDSKNLVILSGGSGITPAIAMAHAAKDYHLTVLFGVNSEEEILLRDQLEALVGEKVKVVYVIKDGSKTVPCEKGFITAKVIAKYMGEDPTFFICGPKPMIDAILQALEELDVPERRIRVEPASVYTLPASCPKPEKETFEITLHIGREETKIPARYDESLLTAFERAGIRVHSACRGGSCGFCRTKVVKGEYRYLPSLDGLREADKEMNYVHSCSAFPVSDMEVLLDIPEVL